MINISVIGGDNRNVILSKLLKDDGFNVHTFALKNQNCSSLEECIKMSKYIITAIPFTNDFKNIYCPTVEGKIDINDFVSLLKDKVIVGGKFSDQQVEMFKINSNKAFDLMKNENLAVKNAIPTVEGIVKILIENTEITIDKSSIAIIGFGRIGKRLAHVLNLLGANIYCMDCKKEEVANIEMSGYNVIENICAGNKFDVVVNTVPKLVIGEKELLNLGKETLILDVASKPGGIDYNYPNISDYKVIHALGIPGKVAPITAAKYIEEIIKKEILEV